MTAATVNGNKLDVRAVLKRADHRYANGHGDDDAPAEYIDALTSALRPLLETDSAPADPDPAEPAVDPAQVQRLEDLVAELRKHVEARDRHNEHQSGKIVELKADLSQVRSELAAARSAAPDPKHIDTLRAEVNRLQGRLADADQRVTDARDARDNALARIIELDQALADARAETSHVHAWALDTDGLHDCECGLAFPPDTLAAEQAAADENPTPADPDPMGVLFARLRVDLAGWGK